MTSRPQLNPKAVTIHSAKDLLASEFPEARGAVPGVLCEGVSILAGRPKLGKSWIGIDIAHAVASGGLALGVLAVEQGDVLLLGLEDGWRRLQDRIRTTLKGETAPEGFFLAVEWPRLDQGGLEAIEEWLKEHTNARLVVIDTLKRVRPQQNVRTRLYDNDYDSVAPLGDLARQYHVTVLIIYHTRKSDSDDPLDLVSGTLGLTGAVDGVLVLKRSRGACDATLHVTARDFGDKEIALQWDADLTGWRIVGDAAQYRLSDERRRMIEFLREQNEALTPKAVSDLLGGKYSTIKKLLWTMANDGQLHADNEGRYSLPKDTSNRGNCPVNINDCGNRDSNPESLNGYPVTTVTDVSFQGDVIVIPANVPNDEQSIRICIKEQRARMA